ncbi:skeletal muscle/kidney enriched inositol 5-phosphatase [Exidia glandulosa HHB12029]|uniref:Skeletal muscle/kidney enriched inositol 5-phosphatase n=1 Tax=Exidia glandulosa HHB12029 TaxID=1314781 RepID=A0A165D514_EXIGL|nr:skeletal muscle/kidney enriched inositol 5-phosphatase [Exidia glandulosa HHB12029]
MAPAQIHPEGLLVQIASYNTNLQGSRGVPQDLVDWLNPTLHVSSFLANRSSAPDIFAVGFQELLPLHFGLTGMSKAVMKTRVELIQSQLEQHAPNKERYVLVGKTVYVGCALLVYARDDTVAKRITDVQTQWTGFGPADMGNKSAVGVRFRVKGKAGHADEVFTFVNAHLTAHVPNAAHRQRDWEHILSTLLFSTPDGSMSTLYDTSHLFFHGDLNFRLHIPRDFQSDGVFLGAPNNHELLVERLQTDAGREQLKDFDELVLARRNNEILQGLKEGEFWRFKCSYKFVLGEVDRYDRKRLPAWTDRILFASHADADAHSSTITPLLYTTVPSYTTSDHKPLLALLAIPPPPPTGPTPMITPPRAVRKASYVYYLWARWRGKVLGWVVGWIWSLMWFIGAGRSGLGLANLVLGVGALSWWRGSVGGSTPA